MADRSQGCVSRLLLEEASAREAFPCHHTQREDVTKLVANARTYFFWGEIGICAAHEAVASCQCSAHLDDVEIKDLRGAGSSYKDTSWVDIAMHQPAARSLQRVRCVNALTGLRQEPNKESGIRESGISSPPQEHVDQGHALEVFERDVVVVFVLANLVDDADIGMLDAGGGSCLLQKKLSDLCIAGEVRMDSFDDDELLEAASSKAPSKE